MAELPRETGPWFQTYSGHKVNPMTLESEDVHLADVAHALSMICRFNGHCIRHYSVAQHSVHGAHLALSSEAFATLLDRQKLARWFLIHDAAEAYLVDMPRPVKYADKFHDDARWTKGFRSLEYAVQEVCNQQFMGIKQPSCNFEEAIKDLDNVMLATEREQLVNHHGVDWNLPLPPHPQKLPVWTPEEAERQFVITYRALFASGK